jgi:hypothetical protein
MRAILAFVAIILVFLVVNVHLLFTMEWRKGRRTEAAAYHEAGYAVIGRCLGMICSGASIESHNDSAVSFVLTDPNLIQHQWVLKGKYRDPASVFRGKILTYMAGAEAEREFGFTRKDDDNDREQIDAMLKWLPKSDVSYEQQLRKKARGLIRRHKAKIDLIAKELSKRRRLLADDIDALLASPHAD